MMTPEQLAQDFIALFPHHKSDYDEHMDTYSKLLGHVFFGDLIDEPLSALLEKNSDKLTIRKYIDFIERMYRLGDDSVRNIVEVTILEYLGDYDKILKNAYNYFSDELIAVSISVEKMLGRRNINMTYENGNLFASW